MSDCPNPKFPSPLPLAAPGDAQISGNFRIKNGQAQFKANDGLWYDFDLVRDQGSTVSAPGQVGEE